jgi:hypothetical protein
MLIDACLVQQHNISHAWVKKTSSPSQVSCRCRHTLTIIERHSMSTHCLLQLQRRHTFSVYCNCNGDVTPVSSHAPTTDRVKKQGSCGGYLFLQPIKQMHYTQDIRMKQTSMRLKHEAALCPETSDGLPGLRGQPQSSALPRDFASCDRQPPLPSVSQQHHWTPTSINTDVQLSTAEEK